MLYCPLKKKCIGVRYFHIMIKLSTFATMHISPHKGNVISWSDIVCSIISGQVAWEEGSEHCGVSVSRGDDTKCSKHGLHPHIKAML